MSLLSRQAGGSVLDPIGSAATFNQDPAATLALRERILDGLLPHQKPVCTDEEHRLIALVAGYGAGKSRALSAWSVLMSLDNPGCTGALFAPTHPLVRDVLLRALEEYYEEMELDFTLRISPLPEFQLNLPSGTSTILCRSLENYSRIIGVNLAWAAADEIDTSKPELAARAVDKLLGRLRSGNRRQLGMFSTPEGFGVLYRLFVEEGHKPDRQLYRARSTDNPYLPADFIESLKANYTEAQLKSYLEGEFCNILQAAVYPDFDRELNASDVDAPTTNDTIYIGVDLNVECCWMVGIVERGDTLHVFGESVARDTPGIVEKLFEAFGPWIQAGQLIVCPDASSQNRSTKAVGVSDLGILKRAGLRVESQRANPFIRDRVNTVNVLIKNANGDRRLLVHPSCKGVIRALEQQAYNSTTQQPEKGDGGPDDLSGQADALGYAVWYLRGIRSYQHTVGVFDYLSPKAETHQMPTHMRGFKLGYDHGVVQR